MEDDAGFHPSDFSLMKEKARDSGPPLPCASPPTRAPLARSPKLVAPSLVAHSNSSAEAFPQLITRSRRLVIRMVSWTDEEEEFQGMAEGM